MSVKTNKTLADVRPQINEFLAKMRNSGNIRASCEAAHISRATAYRWRSQWSTFAAEWDEAKDDAVDWLDLEAWKRATQGASDRLLMFLLKAHKPEVYSPVQSVKHSGTGEGGEIEIKQVALTDAERQAALQAMLGDGRLSEAAD